MDRATNRTKDQAAAANEAPVGPFILTSELADRLRQPVSTIRYWRHVGRGPRWIRVGRRVVYDENDVLTWLKEQRAQAS